MTGKTSGTIPSPSAYQPPVEIGQRGYADGLVTTTLVRMDEWAFREGLVHPVRTDPTGVAGPTRHQAAGSNWRRTSRGFYVPASVDDGNVDQRILESSVVVPPAGAITGWAALRWQRGRWFDGTNAAREMLPVDLLISTHDIRQQPGIKPCGEGTSPENIIVVDGVRVTNPVWSTAFAMRYAQTPVRAGLVLAMTAYNDLASIAEVTALLASQSGWTGVPNARRGLKFAGENAWSPAEYFLMVVWVRDGGFPRPLQNVPIFDLAGRHIGTPDLLDPSAGVIGEYDGSDHLRPEQRVVDVRRAADFADHQLESVTMLAGDTHAHFLGRLEAAYRRAGRRRTRRTWTIEPPDWWIPTQTVAQRRALTPEQRARYLRYRVA